MKADQGYIAGVIIGITALLVMTIYDEWIFDLVGVGSVLLGYLFIRNESKEGSEG